MIVVCECQECEFRDGAICTDEPSWINTQGEDVCRYHPDAIPPDPDVLFAAFAMRKMRSISDDELRRGIFKPSAVFWIFFFGASVAVLFIKAWIGLQFLRAGLWVQVRYLRVRRRVKRRFLKRKEEKT